MLLFLFNTQFPKGASFFPFVFSFTKNYVSQSLSHHIMDIFKCLLYILSLIHQDTFNIFSSWGWTNSFCWWFQMNFRPVSSSPLFPLSQLISVNICLASTTTSPAWDHSLELGFLLFTVILKFGHSLTSSYAWRCSFCVILLFITLFCIIWGENNERCKTWVLPFSSDIYMSIAIILVATCHTI